MKDKGKTKEQLIKELAAMHQKIAELEKEKARLMRTDEERVKEIFEIINSMGDALLLHALDGKVIFLNPAYEKMLGYKKSELVGRNVVDVGSQATKPEDIKKTITAIETALKGIAPEPEPIMLISKDGREVPVVFTVSFIKDAKGKPHTAVVVFKDITRIRKAEKALIKSEKKYGNIINNILDAILEFNAQLKFTYASPQVFDISGYQPEEIIGLDVLKFIHPEDVPGVVETMEKALKTGGILTVEFRNQHKDGHYVLVSIRGEAVNNNKEIKYVGVMRDITERKRTEKKLKEYSEKLEKMVENRTRKLQDTQEELVRKEKLAFLGLLAGGIGHELRNPMGSIKNAAYFLNMVLEDPEPEVKEILEILEKDVARSERIISNLLDFTRPKPPVKQKVNINNSLREVLSHTTVPKNIKVVSELNEKLPVIITDPSQLEQIFKNIILNAIQAMPDGGRLGIRSEVTDPRWVTVSIADSGTGIPKENLKKLFEPLFTTKAKGVGLGLALSRILVEGNEGTINVKSEAGKGSTFMVRLPIS